MSAKTLLLLLITILGVSGICYLLFRTVLPTSKTETIEYPPFTIKKKNTYSTRFDWNTSRRVNNSRSSYSIYHQDQLLTFPEVLNQNTGVPGLWKVYMLPDAPQPALLAGSKSVYLITEED